MYEDLVNCGGVHNHISLVPPNKELAVLRIETAFRLMKINETRFFVADFLFIRAYSGLFNNYQKMLK